MQGVETVHNRVLSVGLCCLDVVMVCHSYPEEDSDQRCLSHRWQRGGNASNNATIFAEFGVPCEILGSLSTDVGGQFMRNDFALHKIFFENCPSYEECESPVSTVWINAENGSRTIVHSNVNMPEVTFEDFKNLKLENYAWVHFEIRPHYAEIKRMIEHIRHWNTEHSCRPIKISMEIEKPRLELRVLMSLADVVFISKDFAAACGFDNMTSAVETLFCEIREGGILICAWGDRGACVGTAEGQVHASLAHAPSRIVNTLGAGDTFLAATIISLMRGDCPSDAVCMGCRVAGTKCGMHDTRGLARQCSYLKL